MSWKCRQVCCPYKGVTCRSHLWLAEAHLGVFLKRKILTFTKCNMMGIVRKHFFSHCTRQWSTYIHCDLGFKCHVIKCKYWGCRSNCVTPGKRGVGLLLEVCSFTQAPPLWVNLLSFLMTLQHFNCCCHFSLLPVSFTHQKQNGE